ncbi:MAG: diacylglycerol kinase family lipid kinase, partial [Lachnospiraceae bacterium]|nr:diacylglycerol kinase family lipid kinase [Lachnospiraceae bacterium]
NGVMQNYPKERRPQIGFIPTGSTNDFARSLGIPSEVGGAAVNLVRGVPYAYDIGSFNDQYFNYVAAFGAFTAVTYSTDQNFKNVLGHAAYVLTGISRLQENVTYKCHMKIEADGVELEDDYIFGAIYNATSVGGFSLRNAMNIQLNDGKFGLILIKAPENLQDVGQIVQALMDPNLDSPYVLNMDVEHVRLIPDRNTEWTLDGESGGAPEEVEINVQSRALSILVPKR